MYNNCSYLDSSWLHIKYIGYCQQIITMIYDCNDVSLKEGDIVHDKWGYDLIVCKNDKWGWYGKLVCEKGHSCENIPYSLNKKDITLKTNVDQLARNKNNY